MTTEAEVQQLKKEKEKLIKIHSAKTDVVSMSAHQIRNALSAIKWTTKMFLEGDLGKLTAEQENLIKKMSEDNERAIGIVSNLLLENKKEDILEKVYTFSNINIVELIDESIFDLSGEARTHEIEMIFLKPEEPLPDIHADKEKLRIVFQNLLENGIKYSKTHGKIFIAIKKQDEFIQVSIKDTGIGIPEESKNKIFEKFYRTPMAEKKEAIGSGIGLFTIKKIIEDHKGKVWFESKENEGTTFFFTIPI